MEKDENSGQGNEDLDQAFVEGELNKTVNVNSSNENSNWNLLDDPDLENVKKENEEQVQIEDNLDLYDEKQLKKPSTKQFGGMESSIHFNNKGLMYSQLNAPTSSKRKVEDDEDDDLRQMLGEVFKGDKPKKK